jgi:hypothetical protein
MYLASYFAQKMVLAPHVKVVFLTNKAVLMKLLEFVSLRYIYWLPEKVKTSMISVIGRY